MGTFIICSIIAILAGLAIFQIVRDKKNGKGCGSGCSRCPHSTACHSNKH